MNQALLLDRARLPADGYLINLRIGARVLDQAVGEGGDVGAGEFEDSLAVRDALLEEVDDAGKNARTRSTDASIA